MERSENEVMLSREAAGTQRGPLSEVCEKDSAENVAFLEIELHDPAIILNMYQIICCP